MFTDIIIRDEPSKVTLARPCAHLGERTKLLTLTTCTTPTLAPLYRCAHPNHQLCSPFGAPHDSDIAQELQKCDNYEAKG